mmetsp:Transcript_10583/g.31079  ORF Transcript_10583/g.31079 Transcript_10583/m.31079 type:complete len:233 (-) Transcript_10583:3-701(-)
MGAVCCVESSSSQQLTPELVQVEPVLAGGSHEALGAASEKRLRVFLGEACAETSTCDEEEQHDTRGLGRRKMSFALPKDVERTLKRVAFDCQSSDSSEDRQPDDRILRRKGTGFLTAERLAELLTDACSSEEEDASEEEDCRAASMGKVEAETLLCEDAGEARSCAGPARPSRRRSGRTTVISREALVRVLRQASFISEASEGAESVPGPALIAARSRSLARLAPAAAKLER